jgi:hypothetical protein
LGRLSVVIEERSSIEVDDLPTRYLEAETEILWCYFTPSAKAPSTGGG